MTFTLEKGKMAENTILIFNIDILDLFLVLFLDIDFSYSGKYKHNIIKSNIFNMYVLFNVIKYYILKKMHILYIMYDDDLTIPSFFLYYVLLYV